MAANFQQRRFRRFTAAAAARRAAELEDAIALTLLEVPEFRAKAGLPPREGGDTLETLAAVLGVPHQLITYYENAALAKLRRHPLARAVARELRESGL